MALSGWANSAVMAAVTWIEEGRGLAVGTKEFWQRFGFPLPDDRRDVVRRAKAVIKASEEFRLGPRGESAADVAGDVGYPLIGGEGGPLDTGNATVFGKIEFWDRSDPDNPRLITARSFSEEYPWGTSLASIMADIEAIIERFEEEYLLEGGELATDSVRFI